VRGLSSAAAIGRHTFGKAIEALVIIAIVITLALGLALATRTSPGADSVLAAKSGGLTATIAFAASTDRVAGVSEATYAVTRSVADNDPVMWATTKCYDAAGILTSWVDLPVLWGTTSSLAGTAGPFATSGARCNAYATLVPWRSRVLGSASMWFTVGG
jgi:uncharacterized transporter YbjL